MKDSYAYEKDGLYRLLSEGKISEEYYQDELKRINTKIKENSEVEPLKKTKVKKKRMPLLKKIDNIVAVLILGTLFYIIADFMGIFYFKEYEKVRTFDNLSSPVMEEANGSTSMLAFGQKLNINFRYSYTIYGKVVGTYTHIPITIDAVVLPKDIGLVWGPLAQDRFLDKLEFKTTYTKSRTLWRYFKNQNDTQWYYNLNGDRYLSNNHVLGSTEKIERLIQKVRKGDYIKIEGYLCDISGDVREFGRNYRYQVISDTILGNQNCETIYVTNIKWLKEE